MKQLIEYVNKAITPIVRVNWSLLQKWEDRPNHTNKDDVGIYCVVGKDDTDTYRIYIGKATGSDKFSIRMSAHESDGKEKQDEFLQTITNDIQVMYGILKSDSINLSNPNILTLYIEDIEVRLIRFFNRSHKYLLVNSIKYNTHKYNNSFWLFNNDPNGILPISLMVK